MKVMDREINARRGDIFLADFSVGRQKELKPVLILQNDIANKYMDTTIVASMPDFLSKELLPTHVGFPAKMSNLGRDTVVLTEHLTTLKKSRLKKFVARVSEEYMEEVDRALKISLSLD